MPLYSYRCTRCTLEFTEILRMAERDGRRCPRCDGPARRELSAPRVVNFRAGWYEHVGPDPVYCETAQQLQDACNKHGGISTYLENSSFKVRKSYGEYEDGRAEKREAPKHGGDPTVL